ncbi:MAG: TlpA family protein disulfide reductase, partial [Bacteroidia bacterium]|nr:TlpA family protein disulfide reductase [Bacteroidia bacterium]
KNYYTYNQAFWVDSTTIFKVQDRAKRTEPLLLGKKAPWFACKDTNSKWVDMYKIKSKYLVLVFWDPDCGHCKKAMPYLIEAYPKLKAAGIEFLGACTELEKDKWVKYLRENKLPWINVGDWVPESNFRYDYYIESTPQIFVLDEDKNIIAKKIGAEQLYEFFSKSLKVVPDDPSIGKHKDDSKNATH